MRRATRDAWDRPFRIECTDTETKIVSSGASGDAPMAIDVEPYGANDARAARSPGDPEPTPPKTEPLASKPIANAEQVVRSMVMSRARACYQTGLKEDPTMTGGFHYKIVVRGDGSVKSVQLEPNGTMSPKTVKCLEDALRAQKFAPADGERTIEN